MMPGPYRHPMLRKKMLPASDSMKGNTAASMKNDSQNTVHRKQHAREQEEQQRSFSLSFFAMVTTYCEYRID